MICMVLITILNAEYGVMLMFPIQQACLNSCLANKQLSECGCAEAQFPTDSNICDIKNSTTGKQHPD